MTDEGFKRKLTSILSADAVGYGWQTPGFPVPTALLMKPGSSSFAYNRSVCIWPFCLRVDRKLLLHKLPAI